MATKELSREEQLIKKLKDDKKIILKARYGKTQGPLILCPVIDPVTGQMRGVKALSDEDKKKELRVVDQSTSRKITDGIEINYDNVVDRIDWEWIVYNKEISSSRKECWQGETSLFFVEDYAGEQKQKVSDRELKLEAQNLIMNLSDDRRNEVTRLFGVPAHQMEPFEVKEFLYEKAEKFPKLVIDRVKDEKAKEKLFVMELTDAGIIKQDAETKVFLYGDLKLGSSFESLISWVRDQENQDLVREMQLLLKK